MDKLILSVGFVLIALGLGFLAVASTDYSLSSAYTTGGYLWLAIGAITSVFGYKVKGSKEQLLGALR